MSHVQRSRGCKGLICKSTSTTEHCSDETRLVRNYTAVHCPRRRRGCQSANIILSNRDGVATSHGRVSLYDPQIVTTVNCSAGALKIITHRDAGAGRAGWWRQDHSDKRAIQSTWRHACATASFFGHKERESRAIARSLWSVPQDSGSKNLRLQGSDLARACVIFQAGFFCGGATWSSVHVLPSQHHVIKKIPRRLGRPSFSGA
jgi:hypothetical protein